MRRFVPLVLALILLNFKDHINKTTPYSYPLPTEGATSILSSNESKNQNTRAKWMEALHRSAPSTNWRSIEYRNRIAAYRINQTRLDSRNDCTVESFAEGMLIGRWQERGSINQAGCVLDVEFHPFDNEIWLISGGGTLWRGPIDGSDWKVVNQDLQFDRGLLKIVSTQHGDRLLAFLGNFPHYSDDGGHNWNAAEGLTEEEVLGGFHRPLVLKDPNRTIYFLAKSGHDREAKIKLYRSTDKGQSYIQVANTETSDFNKILLFSPHHSTIPYLVKTSEEGGVKIYQLNPSNTEWIPLNSGSELNWKLAAANMSGWSSNELTYFYAYTQEENKKPELFRSSNFGQDWERMGALPHTPWPLEGIYVTPSNPNVLFLGQVECYKSTNGGAGWDRINRWWEYYDDIERKLHADIMHIAEFKTLNGSPFLLVSNHGGLSISFDHFDTQYNIGLKHLNVSQYYSVRTDPNDPNFVYAGSQDQGLQLANQFEVGTSGKENFSQIRSGDFGHLVFTNSGQSLWAIAPGGWLHYYENAQSGDLSQDYILGASEESIWLTPLMASPFIEENIIYMAGGSINDDAGSHIVRVQPVQDDLGLSQFPFDFKTASGGGTISAMASSSNFPNYWYVGTSNGKFYYSEDAGQNWNQSTEILPRGNYLYGQAIHISQSNPLIVYFGGSGYSNSPLFQSTDGGRSFHEFSEGLPSTLVYDITANEDESLLFAATEAGPYVYSTEKQRWFNMMGQCTPSQIYWSVEYIVSNATVRFGTYGRGIWDFQINLDVNTEDTPLNTTQAKVFPNPNQGLFHILLENLRAEEITIKAIDVSGRVIKQMKLLPSEASIPKIPIDLSPFPSGIYFLQIQNGHSFITKKVLLRKTE